MVLYPVFILKHLFSSYTVAFPSLANMLPGAEILVFRNPVFLSRPEFGFVLVADFCIVEARYPAQVTFNSSWGSLSLDRRKI